MMAEISEGRALYLPQLIIQEIMSRLSPRDATQMCVLSRDWNHAFNTLPALEFDEKTFRRKDVNTLPTLEFDEKTFRRKDVGEHDTFLEYIDRYITRRHELNLSINSMRLLVFARDDELKPIVPKWIDIASSHNLRHLSLGRIVKYPDKRWYKQMCPDLVSDTISVLHVSHLSMEGVKTRLPRLEELVLHRVQKSEEFANELMLSCPALRRVELIDCSRSKDLLICGPKLKTFEASAMFEKENLSISISAPNLISFSYISCFTLPYPDEELSALQVHGTRNLRELALDLCIVGMGTIRKAVSQLHLLETLRLKGSPSAERIRITHKNLKHLALTEFKTIALTRFKSLIRVKTQTPNLVSFQYDGPNILVIGPQDSTTLANARLEVDFGVRNKRRSYLKAAKFLRYFGRCDSLTLICKEVKALVLPEEIKSEMLPPLWNVKHLRLQILSNTSGDVDTSSRLTESLRWMSPNLETLVISS